MLQDKLRGVSAITVTPFDEDLKIEQGMLEKSLEYLANSGIEVIVPCGNISEFYSLTVEESKRRWLLRIQQPAC